MSQVLGKALDVIAVLAVHGHSNAETARKAFATGSDMLVKKVPTQMPDVEDWGKTLDEALPALDQLNPGDKEKLVKAMISTVMTDEKIAIAEMELLRVVCSMIHVPLPMITGGESN